MAESMSAPTDPGKDLLTLGLSVLADERQEGRVARHFEYLRPPRGPGVPGLFFELGWISQVLADQILEAAAPPAPDSPSGLDAETRKALATTGNAGGDRQAWTEAITKQIVATIKDAAREASTRAKAPRTDHARLAEALLKHCVRGWRGMTPRRLSQLHPVNRASIADADFDREIRYNPEIMGVLLRDVPGLADWVASRAVDTPAFTPDPEPAGADRGN